MKAFQFHGECRRRDWWNGWLIALFVADVGIIAVVFVGLGTYISHHVIERGRASREAATVIAEGAPA